MATYSGAALQQAATPCDLLRVGLDSDPDGLALVSAGRALTWRSSTVSARGSPSGFLGLGLSRAIGSLR